MSGLNYETAEALVYDPVAANRSALRAALSALGFQHINTVSAPVDFAYANYRRNPDIIFCEIRSAEPMICDQIQALRTGAIGNNPFVVIVATTWEKSEALIRRVINAGADDLLLRPFSTGILSSHVDALVERRSGFVITHDYIGPDRRRDPNRVSTNLFRPPNTLQLKVQLRLQGPLAARQIEREISAARQYLGSEKFRVDAFQMGVLYRLVRDSPPCGASYLRDLEAIHLLSRSISRRGAEVKMPGVAMWCNEIDHAMEMIDLAGKREEALRIFERASTNLYQTVVPEKNAREYSDALDAAIKTIRERALRNPAPAGAGENVVKAGGAQSELKPCPTNLSTAKPATPGSVSPNP